MVSVCSVGWAGRLAVYRRLGMAEVRGSIPLQSTTFHEVCLFIEWVVASMGLQVRVDGVSVVDATDLLTSADKFSGGIKVFLLDACIREICLSPPSARPR